LVTLVGMGLVFGAIVVFWVFMSLLVRVVAGKREVEAPERTAVATKAAKVDAASMAEAAVTDAALRRQAALVAVVVALAEEEAAGPGEFPLPPQPLVSSWQAVMRARQLGERGVSR
jgi:Na+-transporting methylmalonyl-CoA/oxaloacetate decarboxylase gamma subunit